MKNWSVDTEKLKQSPDDYNIWRLEQLINYGLDGEILSRSELLKYWDRLVIDPKKKQYLEVLLQ
jgi:hypothetical protein